MGGSVMLAIVATRRASGEKTAVGQNPGISLTDCQTPPSRHRTMRQNTSPKTSRSDRNEKRGKRRCRSIFTITTMKPTIATKDQGTRQIVTASTSKVVVNPLTNNKRPSDNQEG